MKTKYFLLHFRSPFLLFLNIRSIILHSYRLKISMILIGGDKTTRELIGKKLFTQGRKITFQNYAITKLEQQNSMLRDHAHSPVGKK